MAGWQQLYWDNTLVCQRDASEISSDGFEHRFTLQAGEQQIECQLRFTLNWQPFALEYQLLINGQLIEQDQRHQQDLEREPPQHRQTEKRQLSLIGIASLGFKLLKSAKVIKALLAVSSVAAYSWFFSWQFALILIGCLVFHEYGHIRAMKYFGMKTKGIYLIPFIGGLALGDSKISTRWQDVVISIMGPTFGMLLSVLALVLYWITDMPLFAGVAAFNALLNLFNLLPILPLDGGHVLKSIGFSMNSLVGLILCGLAAAAGVYLCYLFGFTLLGFLLAIGCLEIVFEWRYRHHSPLLPLDRYGQIVSGIWYTLTVAILGGIIWHLADSGNPLLAVPMQILNT